MASKQAKLIIIAGVIIVIASLFYMYRNNLSINIPFAGLNKPRIVADVVVTRGFFDVYLSKDMINIRQLSLLNPFEKEGKPMWVRMYVNNEKCAEKQVYIKLRDSETVRLECKKEPGTYNVIVRLYDAQGLEDEYKKDNFVLI